VTALSQSLTPLALQKGGGVSRIGVVALQLELRAEDNLDQIVAEIEAARRRLPWGELFVLPELCTYGPSLRNAQPPGSRAESVYRDVARRPGIWLVPGSLLERRGEAVHNVALLIDPQGEVVGRYAKLFPFLPYEEGVKGGGSFCTFRISEAGCCGLSICYDLWFPETSRTLAWLGAEVILAPTLTNTIDRDTELAIARATAAINQCYVINVNATGPLALGRSIACGPGGEVLHQAGTGQEVFAVLLDLAYVSRVRHQGWHGLGQNLKSFRDSGLRFPPYEAGARSAALDALGPLEKPRSTRSP